MRYLSYAILLLITVAQNAFVQSWRYLGLNTEAITAIAVDWSNPQVLYAGSGSDFSAGKVGGIFKSTNGGTTWDTLIRGVTVREIDIHPKNSNIIYVTLGLNVLTTAGIIKTIDGGTTWLKADYGMQITWEEGPGPLVIDPKHPDTLYAGTAGFWGGKFYRSTDGGQSWFSFGDSTYLRDGVSAIALDPENTKVIYAGTYFSGNVLRSFDGGINWNNTGLKAGIVTIEFSKKTSKWYLGGVKTNDVPVVIFTISNNDSSWENFKDGLPDTLNVAKIQILNNSPEEQVFLLGHWYNIGGVYRSINGNRWEKIGSYCEGFKTMTLLSQKIYAGGKGVFVMDIPTSVFDYILPLPHNFRLYNNFPNPFNPSTTINYEIKTRSMVFLEIFDIQGKKIKTLVRKEQTSGKYSIFWNGEDESGVQVTSGVYFCVLRTEGHTIIKKMLLLR